MIRSMREEASSWYMQILLVVLALSFVLFFDFGGGPSRLSSGDIASVGGEKLTANEFGQRYQSQMAMFGAQGLDGENEMIQNLIRDNIVRQFINEKVGYLEASKLGIHPSPEAVTQNIKEQFTPKDGSFNYDIYKNYVRNRLRKTPKAFEEGESKKHAAQTYQDWLSETIVASPLGLKKDYMRKNNKRSIAYVQLTLKDVQGKLSGQTQPTPEDIQTYYDGQKTSFMSSEKKAFDLLRIQKKEDETLDNDAFFKQGQSALDLVKQDTSINYQTYASEQDSISFIQTDLVSHDDAVKDLPAEDLAMILNATMALQTGEQSEVLQSRDGQNVYLAKIKETRAPTQKSLEEVSDDIKQTLTQQNSKRLFGTFVQNLSDTWKASSQSLTNLAQGQGFEVKTAEDLVQDGSGNIANIGPMEEMSNEVFSAQTKANTFLSKPFETSDAWVLAQVTDVKAADMEAFKTNQEELWNEASQDLAFSHLEQLTELAKKSLKIEQVDLSTLKF